MSLTSSVLVATCVESTARCEGSCFGVAGGGAPFAEMLRILCLQLADCSLHMQRGQPDVRGVVLGLLAGGVITFSLHVPF